VHILNVSDRVAALSLTAPRRPGTRRPRLGGHVRQFHRQLRDALYSTHRVFKMWRRRAGSSEAKMRRRVLIWLLELALYPHVRRGAARSSEWLRRHHGGARSRSEGLRRLHSGLVNLQSRSLSYELTHHSRVSKRRGWIGGIAIVVSKRRGWIGGIAIGCGRPAGCGQDCVWGFWR